MAKILQSTIWKHETQIRSFTYAWLPMYVSVKTDTYFSWKVVSAFRGAIMAFFVVILTNDPFNAIWRWLGGLDLAKPPPR